MTMPFKPNPGRADIMKMLNKAVAESKTITIKAEGDSGRVSIRVGTETIARFHDIYEAVSKLLPEQMETLR